MRASFLSRGEGFGGGELQIAILKDCGEEERGTVESIPRKRQNEKNE